MVKNAILWRLRSNHPKLPDTESLIFTSLNAVHRFLTTKTNDRKWRVSKQAFYQENLPLTLSNLRTITKITEHKLTIVKGHAALIECNEPQVESRDSNNSVKVIGYQLLQLEIFP